MYYYTISSGSTARRLSSVVFQFHNPILNQKDFLNVELAQRKTSTYTLDNTNVK
jgi:hypothetical protein